MKIWLDAQLSPALTDWLSERLGVDVTTVKALGLRDSADSDIFQEARAAGAVVMTNDRDFVLLLEKLGPPPQVIWITCGNTSNARPSGSAGKDVAGS